MICKYHNIDCDNANENGYCKITVCNSPDLLRNLVPLNADPDWSKIHYNNPWHTGKPTEEGWYVCFLKIYLPKRMNPNEIEDYRLFYFDEEGYATNNILGEPHEIIAYQKIEPYKGE